MNRLTLMTWRGLFLFDHDKEDVDCHMSSVTLLFGFGEIVFASDGYISYIV